MDDSLLVTGGENCGSLFAEIMKASGGLDHTELMWELFSSFLGLLPPVQHGC